MENKKPFQLDQVAIRMVEMPPLYSEVPLNGPAAVIKVMVDTFKDYDREVFAIVNLRTDLKPINMNIVSIGALNQSLAHPREAIKSMVLSNAASVLLVHNHVTGKMEPSREDIALTDRLSNICNLMGIELMDHVIVGPGDSYFSFHERGEMPVPKLSLATNMEDLQFGGMKVAETATYEKTKKMIVSYTVSECGEFHNLGELHEGVKTIKEAIELFKKIPPERMNGIPAIGVRVTDPESPELFSEIDVLSGKRIDVDVLSYVPEIRDDWQAQQGIAELIHVFPDKEIIGEVPEGIQKKLQIIESREKQAEQLNGIMDQLEQGVQDVFNSGKYQQYLDTMAKFPRYSVNNSLLIMMQKPDAQMCQSFTGWKQMGRFVKKGEKGIKILAPAPYTVQRERNKVDEQTGKPVFDKDGEPVTETVEIKITGFKVVSTFDLSQTDGKELPSLGVSELQGSIENYGMMFAALKEICPVPITFEHIDSGAKGYYHTVENRIAIQDGMSEVQTLKTAIHEMAHQKLHSVIKAEVMDPESRSQKEVEAESVAYVVCQHFGINTSDYSFGYVAGWSEGKETPELKASLNTIRLAASDIISGIENVLQHDIQLVEEAAKQFTSIFMDNQEEGNFMLGEYLSEIHADPDMSKISLDKTEKMINSFLEKEQHSDAEINQLGKELISICQKEGVGFVFRGEEVLAGKENKEAAIRNNLVNEFVDQIVSNANRNSYYLQDDDTFDYRENCNKSLKNGYMKTVSEAKESLSPEQFKAFMDTASQKLDGKEFSDTSISSREFIKVAECIEKFPEKETEKKSVRKKLQSTKEKVKKESVKKAPTKIKEERA